MSHITSGQILSLVGPIFADPVARQCLSQQECARVDAILQKNELSRRDKRRLARAVEDVITHEGDED
jgi:hypothetical protein